VTGIGGEKDPEVGFTMMRKEGVFGPDEGRKK